MLPDDPNDPHMGVTSDEIRGFIEEFLRLIEVGRSSVHENENALVILLDKLALTVHAIAYTLDERQFPDVSGKDQQLLRKCIESRFPNYGYYNIPAEVSTNIAETQILVGDAIDDILEIVNELYEVIQRWHSNSIDDALWHFEWGYRNHWGNHLRDLQWYLMHHARKVDA